MDLRESWIVFFDGQCEFCEKFVHFIFKRDSRKRFYYAPLQGDTAKNLLKEEDRDLKSIVFFKENQIFKESKSIFEIMKCLYPRLTFIFSFLPYGFYDIFYRWVAKRRFVIWKKKSHLYEPSELEKKYFLP